MSKLLTQLRPDQATLVRSVVSDVALEGVANRKQLQVLLEGEVDWRLHPPETTLQVRKLINDLDTTDSYQEPSSISTAEVIDKFLAAKKASGLSEASIRSYHDTLRVFARYCPTLPTTPEEIEKYLTRFKPDKPTARDAYTVINLMYVWASDRLGVLNTVTKVAKPRFRAKIPDRLTLTQCQALLDAIGTDQERALVYCFLGLGLRLSEAQRLNIGDIGQGTILIHGKERTESMPLLPEIREALLKVTVGRKSSDLVFVGQRGRLSSDMIGHIIRNMFMRTGISGVKQGPYTLRHSRGALTTAAGLDSYSSRRLLRHRSTAMTDLYSQLNLDELRAKEERYNPLRLLAGPQRTFNKINDCGEGWFKECRKIR